MCALALRAAKRSSRAALHFCSGSFLERADEEEEEEEESLKAPISHKQGELQGRSKKRTRIANDFASEIQSLCRQGKLDSALERLLVRDQLCPTRNVYFSLLKTCIQQHALPQLMQIHAHLTRHKAHLPVVVGDYLVVALAKCGALDLARQTSIALPHRTVYSWTSMIAAYTDSGQAHEALNVFHLMQADGVDPDHHTFVSVLKACGSIPDLKQGKHVHNEARRMGFASDVFVGNTLVSMYGKCGDFSEAESVFCNLSVYSEVAYNSLLSVYVEQGCTEKVLLLYRQMQEERIGPNELTFAITMQACHAVAQDDEDIEHTKALEIGRALHHDAQNMGLGFDAFLGNMLVSMYGKCGMVAEAEITFCRILAQDVKSWTQMLAVYVEHGEGKKALQFYKHILLNGVPPDSYMIVTALQACSMLVEKGGGSPSDAIKERASEIGGALHKDALKEGFVSDVFVATALLTMYGKLGRLADARTVFNKLLQRTTVSWTAMFSIYIEQGEHSEALLLYKQMQEEFATLDDVTIICILQACREMGNSDICMQLHFAVISAGGYGKKISLPSTLVNSYANCASMADAHAVLDELVQPDVVSWSACLAGCAGEGSCVACLKLLEAMQMSDIKPNEVTFASVLSACSHAGFAPEGLEYFGSMVIDHGIDRDLKHYVNLTDLLGRAGDFKKLEDILNRMPMQPDLTIWLCLLGMCLRHGNLELGKQAFNHACNLHPTEAVTYILMSNIYVDAQIDPACQINCFFGLQEDAAG